MNFKEILRAWIISFNPNEAEKQIAELRYEICDKCPSRNGIFGVAVCKECGCPIAKKIFTNTYNPCPLGKWGETDTPYIKKEKTLM